MSSGDDRISSATVTCESCGSEETEVFAVHRVYVTPADWDTVGREDVQPDVERWCYACLASYPHEMVGGQE
jgi:hypothetical protein